MIFLGIGLTPGLAEHVTINVTTTAPTGWTVSSSGISNVVPYIYYNNSLSQIGISVSSTGNGNGFFLLDTNLSYFDGYWTASYAFYLPPTATNVVLNYSNLGFDDAGVLFLNTNAIDAAETVANSAGSTQGQFVFVDGSSSLPWSFNGPNYQVSGTVTNGFVFGRVNTINAIVNNTGQGANGIPLQGLAPYDDTDMTLSANVSYDINVAPAAISIGQYPGIQINGTMGAAYQIQYSTNLVNGPWNTLTNVVLTSSPFLFFDTDSITSHSSRYYQAVSQ